MPEFWINMGPQHPMTHGLWNMKVKVDGETVTDAEPEIGYLHRGYEKIMEVREFQKNVVLTDRLCYVSSITWSHAYCLAVEKMMGIETPERGQWIRVVALELQRIASHLMWLAAYGPDLGLLTGLLWALRERELFLDLIQLMSGARMNQNYPRVGGVRNDLPENFEAMCRRSIEHFLEKVDNEYQRVFQESKVFHMRTEGVGKISAADAIDWGVTGPNLRACGVNVDLRRLDPYEVYEEIDFEPQVWHDGGAGDSYARFVCRFNELRESCQIILQALEKMPKTGPYRVKAPRRAEGEGYAKTGDSRGEALFYVIGGGRGRLRGALQPARGDVAPAEVLQPPPGPLRRHDLDLVPSVLAVQPLWSADAPRNWIPAEHRRRRQAPAEREPDPAERGLRDVPHLARPDRLLDVDDLRRAPVEQRILRREPGPRNPVHLRRVLARAARHPDRRLVREQQVHPRGRAAGRRDAHGLRDPDDPVRDRPRVLHRLPQPADDRPAAGSAAGLVRSPLDPGVVRLLAADPRVHRVQCLDDGGDGTHPVRHPRGGGGARRRMDDGVFGDAIRPRLRVQVASDDRGRRPYRDPLPRRLEWPRVHDLVRGRHPGSDRPGGGLGPPQDLPDLRRVHLDLLVRATRADRPDLEHRLEETNPVFPRCHHHRGRCNCVGSLVRGVSGVSGRAWVSRGEARGGR